MRSESERSVGRRGRGGGVEVPLPVVVSKLSTEWESVDSVLAMPEENLTSVTY